MASRTLINGTGYAVKGGRVLVGGTGYQVKKGRTLIGGTGYDISFQRYKLQYPPMIDNTSGVCVPTYSMSGDELTMCTGTGRITSGDLHSNLYCYLQNMDGSTAVLKAGDVFRTKFEVGSTGRFYSDGGIMLMEENWAEIDHRFYSASDGFEWTCTKNTIVRFDCTRHTEWKRYKDSQEYYTVGGDRDISCTVTVRYFEVNGQVVFGHL